MLNVLVVNISDLQSNTVSVERIKEYSEMDSEVRNQNCVDALLCKYVTKAYYDPAMK